MKHILVIRLSAMGDVAISVPIIKALSEQYPDTKITILTRPLFAPMFSKIPNCEVFCADLKGKHKGLKGIYRLYKELKKRNIDAVADLHSVLRTHILRILFRLSGISVQKIDKGRAEKKALTRAKNKIFKPLKTSYERYADVFKALGYPLNLEKNYFLSKAEGTEKVKNMLLNTKNKIGIAPFAAHKGKQYPFEKMKNIIIHLSQNPNNTLYIFGGGKKEKDLIDTISTKNNIINCIGQCSFEEELQLISHLNIMLAMDSGNAHLSAMYGVPTITLWGVTHPFCGFAPYGQPQEHCLLADREQYPQIPTSVFGKSYPEGYEKAIETISEDTILSTLYKYIE